MKITNAKMFRSYQIMQIALRFCVVYKGSYSDFLQI